MKNVASMKKQSKVKVKFETVKCPSFMYSTIPFKGIITCYIVIYIVLAGLTLIMSEVD